MTKQTTGWLLDQADRAALLVRFPPAWPEVIAHHVTLAAHSGDPLPGTVTAAIVGEANDGEGLQALAVAIDGTTDRPDGSTYHITWSLDPARGRRAIQSNDVLARDGFDRVAAPIPIRLIPAYLD